MDISPLTRLEILWDARIGTERLVMDVMLLADDAVHHGPRQAMEIMLEGVTICSCVDPEYISVQASYSSSVREDISALQFTNCTYQSRIHQHLMV